ncbi:hypothetical protein E0494_08505 [Marinilabiliaceae bacterium JC040]|nr:hypothetical protein [Marinilabiliaceae bacterium JC040]
MIIINLQVNWDIAKSKNLTKANNSVKSSNLKSKSKLPMEAFKKFDDAKMHLSLTKGLNKTVGKVNSNVISTAIGTTTARMIKKEDEKT